MIRPIDCPICRRKISPPPEGAAAWLPFCSERCRQVDLLRWSKGTYAIIEPLSAEQMGAQFGDEADVEEN